MTEVAQASTQARPLLSARGIGKTFGHVVALNGASLEVYPGEFVALVGDNGAGKSTLINVLSGVIPADAGVIEIGGKEVVLKSPNDAAAAGIQTVYQDLALVGRLDSAENLFLGRPLLKSGILGNLGFIDRKKMRQKAREQFGELGVDLPSVTVPIEQLSGGQRQMVAVARAAATQGRVVFLDEPTAALAVGAAEQVIQLTEQLRARGVGIVLISHDLPQVLEVADRIFVLRHGRTVGVVEAAKTDMEEIVALMTGAKVLELDTASR